MSHRPACDFRSRSLPAVVVIDAFGNVDDAGAYELGALITRAARAGRRAIVVNFAPARRIGATGLAAVLDMCTAAARHHVVLKAICPPRVDIDLLLVTKLATCVDIYLSEAEALAAFEADAVPPASPARAA